MKERMPVEFYERGINRYIVGCKCGSNAESYSLSPRINRYIVGCK